MPLYCTHAAGRPKEEKEKSLDANFPIISFLREHEVTKALIEGEEERKQREGKVWSKRGRPRGSRGRRRRGELENLEGMGWE